MENPSPMMPSADVEASPKELVPARMLNEFAYCPRLCYMEWVQGEFRDSACLLYTSPSPRD